MSIVHYYGIGKTKDSGNVTKTVNVPQSTVVVENVGSSNYGGGPLVTEESRDVITYTTKPPNNRQASNYCIHSRTRTRYTGDPLSSQSTHQTVVVGNDSDYHDYQHHITSRSFHTSALSAALSPYVIGGNYLSTQGQALINNAIADLKPDLTVASAPNFILELGDVKRMFDIWNGKVGLGKNLAGGHLNYAFGWKPFIGDLKNIIQALSSTVERINQFQQQLNKLTHRSKVVLRENYSLDGSSIASETKCSFSGTLKREVTAHAVWRAKPLEALSAEMLYVRGVLDSLGFELNPAIVWNAIPFSFVIDWLVNVGSYLDRFKVDTLELPVEIVDTYLQYKEDIRFESNSQITFNRTDFAPWIRSGSWVFESRFFHRLPIRPEPAIFSSLDWKGPSANQLLLGASLIIANR